MRVKMAVFNFRKSGGFFLAFASIWLLSPAAEAQVALPSLAPTTVTVGDPLYGLPSATFVTANPAAIQWGEPSRWGFGQIASTRTQTPASGTAAVEYGGLYLGFRKVDKDISFAAERLEFSDDTNPIREGDWGGLEGAVAFQSGENIAFGVGMDRISNTDRGDSQEFNTINLGMSIKLGRKIFFGFSIGTEDISSSINGGDDRSVQKYGVGYRTGRTTKVHLEAYIVDKDQADNFAAPFTDVAARVLVAEVNLSGVLLATSFNRTERPRLDVETETLSFDVGWAPKNGVSVMFHIEQTTSTDSTQGNESEFASDTTSISAAIQF